MPVLPAAAFPPSASASSSAAAGPFGSGGDSTGYAFGAGGSTGYGGGGTATVLAGGYGAGLASSTAATERGPARALNFFVSEALVRDRLQEFQRLARERNALPALLTGAAAVSNSALNGGDAAKTKGFMREFFDCINEIQGIINRGRANVKVMGEVLEDALQATTQDKQKEISDHLQNLVQDTNGLISVAKTGLEQLKTRSEREDAKKPNSAEGRIRKNMQQAMAKKHQQLLLDFQKAQVDYKKALERRQQKEMEILMPDATDAERAQMIEDGETTSLVVAKKMAGAHALLLDEVQRIREKHQDIMRLEASIADLAQMFQEMAVLVEAQGEMLDNIELNVHKTVGYTAKAEKELITTRKEQHKAQRWMCCLTVTLVIVMIIILGPVLLKYGG